MGQQIVKAQERHGWGKSVVEQLSTDFKQLFKRCNYGFSPQNLWYMRQLYCEYKGYPKSPTLVGEIAWSLGLSEPVLEAQVEKKMVMQNSPEDIPHIHRAFRDKK